MKKFLSKTHLLKELGQVADRSDLRAFVSAVSQDSLNNCRIKSSGTLEEILISLMTVPKAVLEDAFEKVFGEVEEEDEEDEDDEDDEEVENEEDEESDDEVDEDCECDEEE